MKITANGISIAYWLSGAKDNAVVVLSHSLGSSSVMWEAQVAALEQDYQVLQIDTRGHGETEVTTGEYSLNQLGDDAVAVLDSLSIGKVHWVGLSMGGMIGQDLALRYSDRLISLSLCDTTAVIPEDAQPVWLERIDTAQKVGMNALLDGTMERWFTDDFRQQSPPGFVAIRDQFLNTNVDGFVGCSHAIRRLDYLDDLNNIELPTQIIVGDDDLSTPVSASEAMHAQIPRSKLTILPHARHMSNIEQVTSFNDTLLDFLMSHR